jgi:ATP-dependent Clp protease ATP-binding subunit ClpC
VIVLAQDEARQLNHPFIGTEHFLLGLVRDQNEAAGKLADLGADARRLRAALGPDDPAQESTR